MLIDSMCFTISNSDKRAIKNKLKYELRGEYEMIIVKHKQVSLNGYYSEVGRTDMINNSYAETTAYIEFELKARFVPSSKYRSFGYIENAFTNLWHNEKTNTLYTIEN